MIDPKEPLAPGWRRIARLDNGHGWQLRDLTVFSTSADMELPGGGVGPTWLVSVSCGGGRATDREVRRALRAFGAVGAEEDNHEPGIARKFFLVADPAKRGICECKTDETTIVEPDGYRYSVAKEGKLWR